MKRKKKSIVIDDSGYDGYYDDVKPEDYNVEEEKSKDDSSVSIKVGALIFSAILIIAEKIMISFLNSKND